MNRTDQQELRDINEALLVSSIRQQELAEQADKARYEAETLAAALRESEGRYRTLFESIDVGFCTIEVLIDDGGKPIDYVFLEVNPAFERQTGIADAAGRRMRAIAPDHEEYWFETYGRIARTGEPKRFQNHAAALGRWYDVYAFRLGGPDELKVGILFNDITERKRTEEALRTSEEQLRLALTAARMGVWRWDVAADTHTRDANLNRLLALPAVKTQQSFAGFLTHMHPDDRGRVQTAFDQSVRHGQPLNVEFRVVWPDGTVRWLRDQGDVFNTAGTAYLAGACVDITDLKAAEQGLRETRDELEVRVTERTKDVAAALASLEGEMARRADLVRRLASAQEDEQRRVARDLHDSVGQLLTGLSLAVRAVETAGPLLPAAAKRLAQVRHLTDTLGRELHEVAVRLRPTALDDLGLEAAVRQLVTDWSVRTGVAADFQATGLGDRRLPAEIETTLYRVVQEALTNVAKHARARHVSVVIGRSEGSAVAVVEDDGIGFDPEGACQAPASDGPAAERPPFGLLGMRERVALVGGTLEVESAPGQGATVIARVSA